MKRTYLAIAFALVLSGAPIHAATISLDYSNPIGPGSFFDVFVNVTDVFGGRSPGDAVIGYGFNVTVGNPAVVSFLGEDSGSLFDDFSGIFPGTAVSGLAGLATNFQLTSADFTEPLTLAILHFVANSSGVTTIGVTSDPSDLNQGLVYADLPYGAVSASRSVAVVPEPPVLAILAVGLALIVVYTRRRIRA